MRQIPAFTVLLLMAVATVVGIATVPLLDVQYAPAPSGNSITVSFGWKNASERIMEAEVTSKIEGVLSGMSDVTSISSVSYKGSGSVTLVFRKDTDMAAARFEVASRIRNVYPMLPDGVSYPAISLDIDGAGNRTALTYIFKSPLPSREIGRFVTNHVMTPLSSIDGVDKVSFWGETPFELEVVFDSDLADLSGITADEISAAFSSWFSGEVLGMAETEDGTMSVSLSCLRSDDMGDMPVAGVGGRIVRLRDIATWEYKESRPTSYFRMNGLNTIMLSIDVASQTNLLSVSADVRSAMTEMQRNFPDEITASLSYDSSEYISSELDKIYFRTALCILILLVFVYLVSRSWRYLFVIFATLVVNVLVAVVFYNIFSLPVHIYTLAGITVSLGIIIDTSIVMSDHYSYYRNRSVFPALLGATATTIGALCIILLLPEHERANLEDFSKVIMINLCVALVTSYMFVPSLIDKFPVRRNGLRRPMKRRRRIVRWSRWYASYIEKGQKRRWVYLLVLVAAFGIPLFLLPEEIGKDIPPEERSAFQNAYNSVMSWSPYAENRSVIDRILGSSFALFGEAVDRSDFYREPGRNVLYVHAGMPEGCSVGQLNDVVRYMENYISKFDEIETFFTRINAYNDAQIEITFKPEYESTSFPAELKSRVTAMATNFGGATWRIWGVNDSYFNNNVISSFRNHRIILKGYNYDDLSAYTDSLISYLKENRRVSGPEIMTGWITLAGTEYNMDYDFGKIAAAGASPYIYHSRLSSMLYDTPLRRISTENGLVPVVLRSSAKDDFDLWHVLNSQVEADSVKMKLSELGSIEKKRTGMSIYRHDQSYEITVGYDFIGSYELASKFSGTAAAHFNDEVLPVGYRAELPDYGFWGGESRMRYALLILLVIAVIYVMCAMTFESLRLPLAVIMMIPVSFIGVFLVFGLSDFTFDQGGFAAFVMLSGIVVNAGIYLLNAYGNDKSKRTDIRKYVRAFNHKINPIMLTVISTVLGLIPFLFDGPDEVFWFAFAVGTIGGMLFSLIALFVFLPVFSIKPPGRRSK